MSYSKEKNTEYTRKWRKANKDKCAMYTRKSRFDGSVKCLDCGKVITKLSTTHRCNSCNKRRLKGPASPAWRGGVTPLRIWIRKSFENDKWTQEVFLRDNYTCQECGVKGVYLNAHHIKPFVYIFNEFLKEYDQFSPIDDQQVLARLAEKYTPFWDINNGQTLCVSCHNKTRVGIKRGH